VSLETSLFPMETDPPNLLLSLPPDQSSPIVSGLLGFDSDNNAQHLQMYGHP
jgi:hypothetical protein